VSRPDVFHFSAQHCRADQKPASAKHNGGFASAVVIGAQQRALSTRVSGQAGQPPGWLKKPARSLRCIRVSEINISSS